MAKRKFKIDITVAVEAADIEEAFALLVEDETSKYIQEAIKASKEKIIRIYDDDNDDNEEEVILIN